MSTHSSDHKAKTIVYQVMSSIPGRIRLRIPSLSANLALRENLKKFIESVKGVTQVRLNPMAESIIVNFNQNQISSAQLENQLAQAIEQQISIASPPPTLSKAVNVQPTTPSQPPLQPTEQAAQPPLQPTEQAAQPPLQPTEQAAQPPLQPTEQAAQPPLQPTEELAAQPPLQPTEELAAPPTAETFDLPPLEQEAAQGNFDPWLHQCQQQAKMIQQLQQQLAWLLATASIGSNLLNKGNFNHSTTSEPENASTFAPNLSLMQTLQREKKWQQLAEQQLEIITRLQQQITEQERLSKIAEFHLNKWKKRFFS
ncbi:HMA2 domain-containing protein [Gloeothece verrucosa]|uniref:Uncharacterized protein n=1 Tax=Gloeothece verrucosa (strain PCC 7822) TaxID=497965 RepID=E0U939_GLOV7|nr:hypothetical protein [Gloeothece verrucosa]ADN16178.1 hypothetical protein Cyan7822_4260 [Gloeothece verrucosa PCC 7822]